MTLFIARYFLKELSAWIVFTPIAFLIFLIIGSFGGMPFSLIFMTVFLSCTVVFAQYHETRKNYEIMFAQFPIDGRTMLHADIAFHGWICTCYILYTLAVSMALRSLIERQWSFLTVNDLLILTCSSLLLIAVSLLLLWWRVPPKTLVVAILLIGYFTSWNFFLQLAAAMNLSFLPGVIGLLIAVYLVIRHKQRRREIA